MLIIGNTGYGKYGNSLNYFYKNSVNLKMFLKGYLTENYISKNVEISYLLIFRG